MLDFTSCLTIFNFKSTRTSDQPLRTSHQEIFSRLDSCIFCQVSTENGFNVVWEDKNFIAFQDHRPAALYHFQVIPKSHIPSVKELQKSDVAMVRTMSEIGHKLLDERGITPSMRRMGFHIPPYNSVDHLHLHVQGLPYKSLVKSAKYPIKNGWGSYHKGFSWFAEVSQTIHILESDRRVGVWPC